MQTENRVFADLAKVATSAMGTFAGIGREVETAARARLREAVGGLDQIDRDEFEAVKAMAANARAEVETLRAELAALRAEVAAKPAKTKAAPIV